MSTRASTEPDPAVRQHPMKLHDLLTYPGSADDVFAMLTDEALWRDTVRMPPTTQSCACVLRYL